MAKNNTIDKKQGKSVQQGEFLFGKFNFQLMLIGLGVIFLGFYLMAGKEDIFSNTKLIVAPVVVLLGFVIELFAIMKSPKENNTEV
jgi:isoprenylcysteine carboxyl methyltransferase (ICMT) family protein YpbQ